MLAALTLAGQGQAAPGDTADRVFGQGGSFTSGTCNLGGRSASSLCNPIGVTVDTAGNLYVAEDFNNRVLEYDSPLTTDAVADRVFGQANFTSAGCDGALTSASTMCEPDAAAVDGAGNLYVADSSNNRVVEFSSPLTTDRIADRVFGQASLTSGTCNLGGVNASSLCNPFGLTLDSGGNLYVADHDNHRVLEYDGPLTTDTVADRVFGQGGSFTSNMCDLGGRSASSLCFPAGVVVDSAGHLYTSDRQPHRVLEYNSPLTTDTVADLVFGQGGSFTTNLCNKGGRSASSLCDPIGVAVDGADNLYVADYLNHRVLEYDCPVDGDGDGLGDVCDPCPAVPDCDGDSYLDGIEVHVGTNPLPPGGFCSADATAHNEEPDARPTDFNDDRAVTGADLSAVAGVIGQLVPPAPLRRDIAPDPAGDNAVTGADLSRVAGVIGSSC